jgi:hypothetical protein
VSNPGKSESGRRITHPIVRLQVVYLFGEDFVPELFADELHGVQVLIEARLVAGVAAKK